MLYRLLPLIFVIGNTVQAADLNSELARIMGGRSGAAVVVGVASGQVLAAYNPDVAARRLARPGSAFKPFTLLALWPAYWTLIGPRFAGTWESSITSGSPTIHQESSPLLCLMKGEDLGCHTYTCRLKGELTSVIESRSQIHEQNRTQQAISGG